MKEPQIFENKSENKQPHHKGAAQRCDALQTRLLLLLALDSTLLSHTPHHNGDEYPRMRSSKHCERVPHSSHLLA